MQFRTVSALVLCSFLWLCSNTAVTVNAEAAHQKTTQVRLTRIIDGDTIRVKHDGDQMVIRLRGVDTPELPSDEKEKKNNPLDFGLKYSRVTRQAMRRWAGRAKQFLVEQTNRGNTLYVHFSGRDGARVVGYVYTRPGDDRKSLGMKLVEKGLARIYTQRFDFAREAEYLRLQVKAMQAQRGIWKLRAKQKKRRDFFIGIHADARGYDSRNLEKEFVLIGNISEQKKDISGFLLVDGANHDFIFPEQTELAPGNSIIIRTGQGRNTDDTLYQNRSGSIWNNDGDKVYLLTPEGEEVTKVRYAR